MTFWHNHNNKAFPAHKMLPKQMYIPWLPRGASIDRTARWINSTVKHLHARKSRQYAKSEISKQLRGENA